MADDFDPDAYLQSTVPMAPTGFNPDDFLGSQLQASPQPEVSTGQAIADVPLSAGIGLVKGGLGMAGLPGDVRELAAKGASKAAGAFGYEVDPATVSKGLRFLPLPGAAGQKKDSRPRRLGYLGLEFRLQPGFSRLGIRQTQRAPVFASLAA